MKTTTIRVSERTHELLQAMATSTGQPMARLVQRAVERLQAEQFFASLDAAYEALHADPDAWAEETAERAAWDATIGDGLEDE